MGEVGRRVIGRVERIGSVWGGDAVEVVEDVSNDRTLLRSDTAVCPLDAGHSARSQLSRCGTSRRACVDHLLRKEGRKEGWKEGRLEGWKVGKGREVGWRRDRSKKVSELRTRLMEEDA